MGINKKRTGYSSYSYLSRQSDIKTFDFVEGEGTFEPFTVPLDPTQEARFQRLLEECIMVSLHEHPHLFPRKIEECRDYDSEGRSFTAFEQLGNCHWDAMFDNLLDGTAMITSKCGWKWTDIIYDVGMRLCDLAHQDFVIRCESVAQIYLAHNEGKLALIPAQEGAMMIENELDRIEILYGIGIRALGLVYSESNALGTGLKEDRDGGLTSFGRRAVERMNDVGMLIDCSHASPQTTIDAARVSRKPIVLSHTGARSLWNIRRLASDEAIRAVAGEGGVIGIEAAPHTTLTHRHPRHNIESVMEHFEYVADLVGIDHVGFGPDTLYGDHVGIHRVYADALSISDSHGDSTGGPPYEEVEYVRGLENPTECSRNILRWLIRHEYSDEDISKVIGGNALRLLDEVWQ